VRLQIVLGCKSTKKSLRTLRLEEAKEGKRRKKEEEKKKKSEIKENEINLNSEDGIVAFFNICSSKNLEISGVIFCRFDTPSRLHVGDCFSFRT
jgi:hypothetical protein